MPRRSATPSSARRRAASGRCSVPMKTSLGIWAFGPMATRFIPGGYQPQWAGESTAEQGAPCRRGARGPHRRLRVPLSAGALRGQPRRGARGARRPRHLLHRDGPPSRPPLRARRAHVTDDETRARKPAAARLPPPTSPARSARTSSSGRGSRATTIRSRRPIGRAGAGSSRESARRRSAAASTASSSSSSTRTRSRR